MIMTTPFIVKRIDLNKPNDPPKTLNFRNTRRSELSDFLTKVVATSWGDNWRHSWQSVKLDTGNYGLQHGNVQYEVVPVVKSDDGLASVK